MEDNHNAYEENKESIILNSSKEEINERKQSEKDEKEEMESNQELLNDENKLEDDMNYNESQLFENNSYYKKYNQSNGEESKIDDKKVNSEKEKNINEPINNNINKENEEKLEETKEKEEANKNNEKINIMQKANKNASEKGDLKLIRETQELKISLNENEKNIKKEEEKNNNKIGDDNDSEHIIDNIIQNELNELPEEEKTENKKLFGKKYTTINDLKNEPFKEMKKDSPRSLQLIHDNGHTCEELYYNPNKKKDDEIIKKMILNTQEKILDDNLLRIKAKNDIELANIVQYELDKNLFKMELMKNEDNFKKEKLKLKPYEMMLKKRNKRYEGEKYHTLENKSPIITKLKSPNENLLSFYKAKRKNEYSFYKQKLSQKLELIELMNIKKNEKFKLKKSMETERAKINLKRSEEKYNKKLENLKKKMEWKDLLTNVIKKVIKDDHKEKRELNEIKYKKKKEYINDMKKKEIDENEKKLELLNKKGEQRKNISIMTKRIYSSNMDKYKKMEKERINSISKIQKILKDGEGKNEKNLDILMEEFPDNHKIIEVIKDYQIKKNEIKNNKNLRLYSSNGNLYNTNISSLYYKTTGNNDNYLHKSADKKRIFIYSNNRKKEIIDKKNEKIKDEERRINNKIDQIKNKKEEMNEDINDIHYEHELKEKIRMFKIQIYKNFLKKIKEERHNEIMRKKQLEMIKDKTLRKNLEIQFSNERALIDIRLRKESESLQKLTKDYENRLKNNFLKKQDKILNLIKDINKKKEIQKNN